LGRKWEKTLDIWDLQGAVEEAAEEKRLLNHGTPVPRPAPPEGLKKARYAVHATN
jgi:hypothetical protein